MDLEEIIRYLMPAYHHASIRHPESVDEAKAIVAKYLETSCLVIEQENGRYIFQELLSSNRTCINRSQNVFDSIKAIIKRHRLGVNGKRYIFHFKGDACHLKFDVALLSNSRNLGNEQVILWPLLLKRSSLAGIKYNPYLLTTGVRYNPYLHDEVTAFLTRPDSVSWDSKIPVFFFRGMNSGNPFPTIRYPWNPRKSRVSLLTESFKLPDELREMVDIGFHKLYPSQRILKRNVDNKLFLQDYYGQYLQPGTTMDELQSDIRFTLSYLRPPVPRTQIYRYKYLFCPEGFDCASALSWALASNSLAIAPPFHYENTIINSQVLKPYVHFLPVREDYTDLADVMRWALAHDDECRQMVRNANAYVQPFLNTFTMEEVQKRIIEKLLA